MKVLMLTDFPRDASDITGGVQSAAYNLVRALTAYTDAAVTVATFTYGVERRESETLLGSSVRVIRLPQSRFGTLLRYWPQRQALKRALAEERPDIVHAQSEGFYATLAVHSGVPNLYTVHGIGLKEVELQRAATGRLRSFLRARLIRAHHRRATNIIAINDYTQNEVAPLHDARVWQIPNAVDESFFELNGADVESGRVLVVGGVGRRKDTATALRSVRSALTDVPDLRLDIVGPVAADYEATLRPELDDPSLSGHVQVHGLVSRDDLRALYRAAAVFLLTSIEESSPIAIVEAMAAGKPVVATDVGGVAEIVEDGVTGYVCRPGDHEGIARAVSRLVLEPELRARFADASRAAAAARWSSQAVALATYNAYEEILRES